MSLLKAQSFSESLPTHCQFNAPVAVQGANPSLGLIRSIANSMSGLPFGTGSFTAILPAHCLLNTLACHFRHPRPLPPCHRCIGGVRQFLCVSDWPGEKEGVQNFAVVCHYSSTLLIATVAARYGLLTGSAPPPRRQRILPGLCGPLTGSAPLSPATEEHTVDSTGVTKHHTGHTICTGPQDRYILSIERRLFSLHF